MTSRLKEEQKAEELVQEDAETALEAFEDTRNEMLSSALEEKTVQDAEAAERVLKTAMSEEEAEGSSPSSVEEKALRDMEKVVAANEEARANAAKNNLFFEDRDLIKAEEAAADAAERTEQFRHRDDKRD